MCGYCVVICFIKVIVLIGFDEFFIEFINKLKLDLDELLMVIKFRRSICKFKDKEVFLEIVK